MGTRLQPDAILFDMDGVLIDSLDSWWFALNDALEAFHHKVVTREEFIERYWGHDLRDNLERFGLNPEVISFCNNIYGNHVDAVQIFDETRSTLKKLQRYKKAIITNTPRTCTKQILEKFVLESYFQVVATSDDVSRGKPDPAIVYHACNQLHISPKNAVLVGDTESDVQAGKVAGCYVVGIKIKADYTVNKLSDVLQLFL